MYCTSFKGFFCVDCARNQYYHVMGAIMRLEHIYKGWGCHAVVIAIELNVMSSN